MNLGNNNQKEEWFMNIHNNIVLNVEEFLRNNEIEQGSFSKAINISENDWNLVKKRERSLDFKEMREISFLTGLELNELISSDKNKIHRTLHFRKNKNIDLKALMGIKHCNILMYHIIMNRELDGKES